MLEQLLRRERAVVTAGLVALVLLAWLWTISGAGMSMSAVEMSRLGFAWQDLPAGAAHAGREHASSWSWQHVALMLAMWWVMMIAMMLPSAAPTILLASALNRRAPSGTGPYGTAAWFTGGYLLAWLGYSALAVAAQTTLQSTGALTAMLESANAPLTGALLVTAGLWQLTPAKNACLRRCRSPVDFLTRHRRPGNAGALRMGLEHGTWCLGCCWALMALLFAGGVMNLVWIAGLSAWVLAEKLLRGGPLLARVGGIACLCAGVAILAATGPR